jgi:hypothetical protein
MNRQVELKFPIRLRLGISFVCLLVVASGIAATHRTITLLIVIPIAVVLTIHIIAYRAEVDEFEVRLRYWPFLNRSIPVADIQQLAEERTLVLITPTSRIPLWGLSAEGRTNIFRVLPRRLQIQEQAAAHLDETIPLQSMRWHSRAAKLAGAGFVATSSVLTPFLHGYSLHKYWEPWGKLLLVADMAVFLLLLFEIGMSLSYWQYLHDK